MPPIKDDRLRELRLRYTNAYTAYQSSVVAHHEATMAGKRRTADQLRTEAAALHELTSARAKLLNALGEQPASSKN
jgi:hypothetical protein